MKITSTNGELYCVTRKNMGDSTNLPKTFSSLSGNCWTTPSSGCGNGSGSGRCSYSGCRRTVCNYWAAKDICAKFKAGGKTWTLPNDDVIFRFRDGQTGDNGLCLCDWASDASAPSCFDVDGCAASQNHVCSPGYVWSHDISGNQIAHHFSLKNGSWLGPANANMNLAFSVRCVTKL